MPAVRRYGIFALGLVMIAFGIISQVGFARVESFGWSAYAPLSDTSYEPLTSTTFSPWWNPYGPFVLMGLGAALVAGWIKYRIGIRPRREPRERPTN